MEQSLNSKVGLKKKITKMFFCVVLMFIVLSQSVCCFSLVTVFILNLAKLLLS